MYDVAIIGCGVIGAAAAYALSRYENKVVILEAENDVADCTTKANSAILHAGYDPAPGTKMARLNVRGVELAKEICAKLDVPYKQCGSLVLALSESELPHLQHLYENGTANGVPDMKILTKEETLAMEPNLSENVCGALWAPSAAIVSPWEYALAMTEVAVRNGVELRRSCRVEDAEAMADGGYRLTTTQGTVEARYVINAAGIWAEKVHCMVEPASFHITPTRGEYYLLDKSEGTRVNHVIFQCPNELGKGVLVSPTVHGNLIVGPDAVPVHGDDTSCTSKGLEFVKTTAQRSVPSINFGESIRNFAGVRANLDVDDFIIGEEPEAPGWIDLAGMKSPGLSAAPAVAEEAVGTALWVPKKPITKMAAATSASRSCPLRKRPSSLRSSPLTAGSSAAARPSPRARSWQPFTAKCPPPPSTASSAGPVPAWAAARAVSAAPVCWSSSARNWAWTRWTSCRTRTAPMCLLAKRK